MTVYVCSAFAELSSMDVRLLHAASRLGSVEALVWSDGSAPGRAAYVEDERLYFVRSVRWVETARIVDVDSAGMPMGVQLAQGSLWARAPYPTGVASEGTAPSAPGLAAMGIQVVTLGHDDLPGFSLSGRGHGLEAHATPIPAGSVIVTGCFDWLHSGHIRFFEEAAAFGPLLVSVGSDATIRALKGAGHPQFPEQERLYCVASVRTVHRAFIGSGSGWLDAAPEIDGFQPGYYVVNEDGDRAEKREFCRARGIQYVVLRREPREGLPQRSSTELRGF
jgi:cytidyltransferase-like protein